MGGPAAVAGDEQAPKRMRYLIVAAACALALVAYVHRLGFGRALPRIGLSTAEAGWLTAAFMVAYGAFEVPLGRLGDRFGSRRLLVLIVLGWSAATALVGLATLVPAGWVLPLLLLLRFFFGACQAGGFPLIARLLTDWVPRGERATAQGFVWTASRLGGMIGPLTIGPLMDSFSGWGIALALTAGLGPLWCIGFWPWSRDRPAGDGAVPGHAHMPWARLLRSRDVWGLCLMYAGVAFGANFYVGMLPQYLEKGRGLSSDATTWLAAMPFGCGMVACVAGGVLSDGLIRRTGSLAWGRRLNGIVALSLGAIGWLAIPWIETTGMLATVLCVVFVCNDLNMGPAWATCADVGERYAGTVGGAMNMMGSLAGALGSVAAGHLAPQGYFALYAGGFLVAAASWLVIDPRRRLTQDA